MTTATDTDVAKEQLMKDFKTVVLDAEELLRATASQTGERVGVARAKVEESVAATKKRFIDMEEGLVQKTKAAARATDHLMHENPWQAAGIAAAVGFLLGMLTIRRG